MKTAALVLVLSLLAVGARAQAPATLTIHGHTASVGAGFTWGAGTLQFEGKTYPVRIDGFVIGGIGTASLTATGTVTGLTKAEDLNGDYTSLAAGGAFGAGERQGRHAQRQGRAHRARRHRLRSAVRPRPARRHARGRAAERAAGRRERALAADARLRRDQGRSALHPAHAERAVVLAARREPRLRRRLVVRPDRPLPGTTSRLERGRREPAAAARERDRVRDALRRG